MPLFEPVFEALNERGVRYVVVGGVAVVLHGHARLTADLDLALDLAPEAARNAIDALAELGLKPRAPVEASDFADPAVRGRWAAEDNMRVFTMWDPNNAMLEVDLFVENPVEFEDLWADSLEIDFGGTICRVASIPHLIQLKRMSDRPEDALDIEALEAIMDRR